MATVAFEEACERKEPLTNLHPANGLATSRIWREVVEDAGKSYPDAEYRSMLVDNAAFQWVKNPTQFNGVVLLENMQGDILTDQAGGVLGSLGLMPSACLGPQKGYVEVAHGSAPDIANQNNANPYSMIGSVAFLFEKCLNLHQGSEAIWNALFGVFEKGCRTAELAAPDCDESKMLTTRKFGDLVAEII